MEFCLEWVNIWRGLPEWMRRELSMGGREVWIWSGMEEVGWERVYRWGGDGGEGILRGEGEVMVTSSIYLMEYLRGLVGGGEFKSFREGDFIVIRMEFGDEVFSGLGLDRERAFFGLLREVGDWYWQERRPSIGDIRLFILERDEGMDLDFRTGEMGAEIYFLDYWLARSFMDKWRRFVLEEGDGIIVGGEEYYHGRMALMEGEFRILSGSDGSDLGIWSGGAISVSALGIPSVDDLSLIHSGGFPN